jgi:short-subunit dehydrogenase
MAKPRQDESVLVTGASAGIGRELASAFAREGYRVVLLARSDDKLRELALELKTAHQTDVTIVPADLGDRDAPRAVFDGLRDNGIEIDVLVNNAGAMSEGPFNQIALDEHLRLLQLNVVALTALTRLFLEPMLSRNSGRILNVASIAAFMPVPHLAAYAASKAYVLSLSEALSEELKGTNVTVTALCPGLTDTGMVHGTDLAKMCRAS